MLNELNSDNFERETKEGLKLVEFYTSWCGYCKKQQLELDQMDRVWIGQVDADKAPSVAAKYKVNSYPTFLVLNKGQEVDRFSGLRTKEDIMSRLMSHLS